MLTISKALSAIQARKYHAREFTSEKENYWSRDQQGHSEWQGRLAQEWGLQGAVTDEHFARLSEGQHPESAHNSSSINRPESTKMNTASRSPVRSIVPDGMRHSPRRSLFLSLRLWAVMNVCAKRIVKVFA